MNDLYEDPELERQLEGAFRSTRPRRGFEDELWSSLQRRRPLLQRVRAGLGRLPWVPALATVSALAVVLVGLLFMLRSGGGHGAGSATSRSQEARSQAQAGAGASASAADSSRGDLAPNAFGAIPPVPTTVTTSYTGGLELSLSAPVPSLPASLPVYRYAEPTGADVAAFAGPRGASQPAPTPQSGAANATRFAGPGTDITVLGSDAANLVGPTYIINTTRIPPSAPPAAPLTDSQATQNAAAYLSQLNLPVPADPAVRGGGSEGAQVLYPNRVNGTSGPVPEIDAQGRPVYTQVSMRGDGQVFQVSGPLPVAVHGSPYPSAAAAALRQLPNTAGGAPRARADLTSARLVYVAVTATGSGYLEPAILLTGAFQAEGRTYEVAVIVPALDSTTSR